MSTLQTGIISGTVVNKYGMSLPGVTVTLRGVGAPHIQVSNAQGQFQFVDLEPGSYEVKATLEGFTSDTQSANVSSDKITHVQFTLQPAIIE